MLYKEALSTKQLNENLLQNELAISKLKQGVEAILPVMVITSGNKTLSVPFNEMAYWFLSDGLVTVVVIHRLRRYWLSYPQRCFFQLSRQFIAHIQSIVSITDDVNRTL